MRYWLFKSEPSAYGIGHLAKDKIAAWTGVRNYQARNFMLVQKTRLVGLAELRGRRELKNMQVLKRGNRLSITPVSGAEWNCIMRMLGDA